MNFDVTGISSSYSQINTFGIYYYPETHTFEMDYFEHKVLGDISQQYVDDAIENAIGDINEVLSHLVTIPEEEQAVRDLANLVDLPEEDE